MLQACLFGFSPNLFQVHPAQMQFIGDAESTSLIIRLWPLTLLQVMRFSKLWFGVKVWWSMQFSSTPNWVTYHLFSEFQETTPRQPNLEERRGRAWWASMVALEQSLIALASHLHQSQLPRPWLEARGLSKEWRKILRRFLAALEHPALECSKLPASGNDEERN